MMRDSQHSGRGDRDSDGLAMLARSVVAQIAARDAARVVDQRLVVALAQALVAPDPLAFEALRPELRRARLGDADLVDAYFPAVARYLGCAWSEDRLPFSDVSIGVARMQSLLRQFGRELGGTTTTGTDGATVLMVLPEGEQHSLGVMVLTGQLRRQGISVQLQIGADPQALRLLAAERRFDCAMVSVACEERLELCGKLVKSLKDGSGGQLWVAVGGAVLDRALDFRLLTGADVVTNDPRIALEGAQLRRLALISQNE